MDGTPVYNLVRNNLPGVKIEGFAGVFNSTNKVILAAMAGERFGRPVRVTLTREQVFEATASRPPTDQQIRIGADADGRLRAVHHRAAYALSPLAEYIEWCTEQAKILYAAPAIRTQLTAVPLDVLPPASMRGSVPQSSSIGRPNRRWPTVNSQR